MDHFNEINGMLYAENILVADICDTVGTPVYIYSRATMTRHYHLFERGLEGMPHLIAYAVKANGNLAVLSVLAKLGAGADVVSIGEYRRALAAGISPDKIVFSGVGKTESEMNFALEYGVKHFNIESEQELLMLSDRAAKLGKVAPISIRVNPDVDAQTHAKISTGRAENKFGIPLSFAMEAYNLAASLPNIEIVGVDMHIGSQLIDLTPFSIAFEKLADFIRDLRAAGHNITRVDLGGGLGIPYYKSNTPPPDVAEYCALVRHIFTDLNCEVIIEPGRLISGNAGILASKVIRIKQGQNRQFVILDAAMNDLLRPAMYDAHHDIVMAKTKNALCKVEDKGNQDYSVDIVGPVCESSDIFYRDFDAVKLMEGDLVAFRSAGAYGASMASEYNTRPLVPEVLVDGSRFEVIRARPSYEEILGRDKIPDWL